jgi:toxin ParE1/3/4
MRIDLSREAQADIDAATNWYIEKRAFNAALDFADEIDRALGILTQYPSMGAPGNGATRMRPLQDFPYTLVYHLMQDHVRVIAVAHHSRQPGYWRGRL